MVIYAYKKWLNLHLYKNDKLLIFAKNIITMLRLFVTEYLVQGITSYTRGNVITINIYKFEAESSDENVCLLI